MIVARHHGSINLNN